jgi:hypothetical protein
MYTLIRRGEGRLTLGRFIGISVYNQAAVSPQEERNDPVQATIRAEIAGGVDESPGTKPEQGKESNTSELIRRVLASSDFSCHD